MLIYTNQTVSITLLTLLAQPLGSAAWHALQ